jgi:DNA-binding response OmpR family regulator
LSLLDLGDTIQDFFRIGSDVCFMKVLLIEDENELANSIRDYLKSNDIICEVANTLSSALLRITDYDCILLDLMLPDGNGFEILKELKLQKKQEGVIIISAKETLETKIEGFNLGVDDYLTKPFHLSELLVRIQALVRRKNFKGSNTVSYKDIEVDLLSKTVKVNGRTIDMTKREIDLLLYLIGNKNRVLSKAAIAEHLSGDMADMLNNYDFVYAHIKNLKKKLNDSGKTDYIRTIYGIGYKWQDE